MDKHVNMITKINKNMVLSCKIQVTPYKNTNKQS